MKRTIIVVIVVALLAGFGYIGVSAQSSAEAALPPQAQIDTKLITIAEDETLASGGGSPDFKSEFIDVKSYRDFKLYVKMTPGPTSPGSPVTLPVVIRVMEHPVGGSPSWGQLESRDTWNKLPFPAGDERYTMIEQWNMLSSMINVTATNSGSSDVQVSIYLLMSKKMN
ncbi:hypothetical protein ACFLTP_09585 [Chloroflexota bacterium]